MTKTKRPVVITGCPKTGTHYIASVLQHLGLEFGHEEYARDGEANWKLAPGRHVSYDAPGEGESISSYTNPIVLHQVRYPLDVIGSCQKIGRHTPEWRYMCRFIPPEPMDNVVEKAMYLYLHWNRMAEQQAGWRYRIENLPDVWPRFCRMIARPEYINRHSEIQHLPTNIGSNKPYPSVAWNDLREIDSDLAMDVQQMAERYGYDQQGHSHPDVIVK